MWGFMEESPPWEEFLPARKDDDDDDGADTGLDPDMLQDGWMMMLLHLVDLLIDSNHGVP